MQPRKRDVLIFYTVLLLHCSVCVIQFLFACNIILRRWLHQSHVETLARNIRRPPHLGVGEIYPRCRCISRRLSTYVYLWCSYASSRVQKEGPNHRNVAAFDVFLCSGITINMKRGERENIVKSLVVSMPTYKSGVFSSPRLFLFSVQVFGECWTVILVHHPVVLCHGQLSSILAWCMDNHRTQEQRRRIVEKRFLVQHLMLTLGYVPFSRTTTLNDLGWL